LHCLRWQPTGLYYPRPRLLAFGQAPQLDSAVAILTAGTADLPVALEARAVLSHLGVRTLWLPDRGVASPRRSLAAARAARAADCAIVVAGFDAALPSVVAALLDRPVIAVPTSTGYGTAAEGRAPLWAALSSCADGLTVVNVDNGYGAACAAYRIVHEHVRRG
jgi:NCAIR mutase (PurE)-related protein